MPPPVFEVSATRRESLPAVNVTLVNSMWPASPTSPSTPFVLKIISFGRIMAALGFASETKFVE